MLPTADAAEVKVPQGLPSKSSTCSKTAALRTLVFYSLDFTVSSLYIYIYIYLFIYISFNIVHSTVYRFFSLFDILY